MSNNDWKSRLGVVYSTGSDFNYNTPEEASEETFPVAKQRLKVYLDKRNRGGKQVTIISGFRGTDDDLKTLGKTLKTKCGVGGSAKEGEIIIQGDFRDKLVEILTKDGYKAQKI